MAIERMNIQERFKYLRMMKERYGQADRRLKGLLLNEMEEVTGLHRQHLITRMNGPGPYRQKRERERTRQYSPELEQSVVLIADTLDWICAERLKPALPKMAVHLAKFDEMQVTPQLLEQLTQISVSTLHRILRRAGRPVDRLPQVRRGRRAGTVAQAMVPIGMIPWQEPEPGHFEVDLVHHSRPGEEGVFICTLQCIDVLTAWSERVAILGHEFEAIWSAFQAFKGCCPMPIRELHTDNGSEFMNLALLSSFAEEMVQVRITRGKPGYKNHNRFVEQKNSSLVRAYLGRLYLHTPQHLALLNQLYADMRLYYNLFQPVLRQTSRRVNQQPNGLCRIVREQDEAKTPLERLLQARPPISRSIAQYLQDTYDRTNPRQLNRCIHQQLGQLASLAQHDERRKASSFQ